LIIYSESGNFIYAVLEPLMKKRYSLEVRNCVRAAAICLGIGVGFISPAFAFDYAVIVNPGGTMTRIGVLPGRSYSEPYDINDAGQVAGASGERAFVTGPDGVGITDLGTLGNSGGHSYALGINSAGRAVGFSYTPEGRDRAFITALDGKGIMEIKNLGYSSGADGINDSGQVAGVYDTFNETENFRHAFITGPNGMGITDIGTLGGIFAATSDINNEGQVVGWSDPKVTAPVHAFITGPDGAGMKDLGTLGGNQSFAQGVNDAGQVVGYSQIREDPGADSINHAFITGPDGAGMRDLGTLGGVTSGADGINNAGQVVGYSDTETGERHAFITGPDGAGMADLNSMVELPSGFYFDRAYGINNVGQVIATVSAIPEPETYALLGAGLALVGFMARRKKQS
jgi:probable HAF family extracellular repeat protein